MCPAAYRPNNEQCRFKQSDEDTVRKSVLRVRRLRCAASASYSIAPSDKSDTFFRDASLAGVR